MNRRVVLTLLTSAIIGVVNQVLMPVAYASPVTQGVVAVAEPVNVRTVYLGESRLLSAAEIAVPLSDEQMATLQSGSPMDRLAGAQHLKQALEEDAAASFLNAANLFAAGGGALSTLPQGMVLDLESPSVFAVPGYVGVSYPVLGAERFSSYTMWMDPCSERVMWDSAVVGMHAQGGVRALVTISGQTTFDQVVPGDAINNVAGSEGMVTDVDWGCVNQCLASMGIPNWILGVIGVACAALCFTGVGCIACLIALGLGLDFEAGFCVGKCS